MEEHTVTTDPIDAQFCKYNDQMVGEPEHMQHPMLGSGKLRVTGPPLLLYLLALHPGARTLPGAPSDARGCSACTCSFSCSPPACS